MNMTTRIPGMMYHEIKARLYSDHSKFSFNREIEESRANIKKLAVLTEEIEGFLDERNHFFIDVLDSIQYAVCYLDGQGRYLYNNKFYENFFGVKRKDIYKKMIYEVLTYEIYSKVASLISDVSKKKLPMVTNWRAEFNSKLFCVTSNLLPIMDDRETIKGILAIDDYREILQKVNNE